MKRVLLDTNVVLRFLLADSPKHHEQAVRLFQSAEDREVTLVLTPEIMAEIIHVLRSYYELPAPQIAQALEGILFHVGVTLTDDAVMTNALESFKRTRLDIADCLLAARSQHSGDPVASFDRDFKKLPEASLYPL